VTSARMPPSRKPDALGVTISGTGILEGITPVCPTMSGFAGESARCQLVQVWHGLDVLN
jgi:hypothetical protein